MKLKNNLTFESILASYEAFYNCEYSDYQKKQLEFGYEDNLDVSQYANPAFNYMQMNYIRRGLMSNLDVSRYAFVEYNQYLMEVIYHLLKYSSNFDQYVINDQLNLDKLMSDYDSLSEHTVLPRLDNWGEHTIYKDAPYRVSY